MIGFHAWKDVPLCELLAPPLSFLSRLSTSHTMESLRVLKLHAGTFAPAVIPPSLLLRRVRRAGPPAPPAAPAELSMGFSSLDAAWCMPCPVTGASQHHEHDSKVLQHATALPGPAGGRATSCWCQMVMCRYILVSGVSEPPSCIPPGHMHSPSAWKPLSE